MADFYSVEARDTPSPDSRASWIKHPGLDEFGCSFVNYVLEFELKEETSVALSLSADQRFELFINDQWVGQGPDRGDPQHWSYHAYQGTLAKGRHELRVFVSYLTRQNPRLPAAQMTREPAFILRGQADETVLDTGGANWQSSEVKGFSFLEFEGLSAHCIGPGYQMTGSLIHQKPAWQTPVVLEAPHPIFSKEDLWWSLKVTELKSLGYKEVGGGRVRSVDDKETGLFQETQAGDWQSFVDGTNAITVKAGQRVRVIWDFENYHCAFPTLKASGQGEVRLLWAESLFEDEGKPIVVKEAHKGDRSQINDKVFHGFGDTFLVDGDQQSFTPPWWRSGRYLLLEIKAEKELTLHSLTFRETRYPYNLKGGFRSSDQNLENLQPMLIRGLEMCAHETLVDCPYFEQLMYVADTRIQLLTLYTLTRDNNLARNCIELFDWSRRGDGLVKGRHPSDKTLLISTFSLMWPLLIHDYAMWQNDRDFVLKCLPGMRNLMELFRSYIKDGILTHLPAWSFVDWVPEWQGGAPPGAGYPGVEPRAPSGVLNMLFLKVLNRVVELEKFFGDPHLVSYQEALLHKMIPAVRQTFWDSSKQLFADDPEHTTFSEHGQALALISGCRDNGFFSASEATSMVERLSGEVGLTRATVYFRHYIMEALYQQGASLQNQFDPWHEMKQLDLKTPWESGHPRSDCHAWASHPQFHMNASLCGIRPLGYLNRQVLIRPNPGSLSFLSTTVVHPDGDIVFEANFEKTAEFQITLPENVTGSLEWGGESKELVSGRQSLRVS